ELFDFDDTPARYVRIIGHGNSKNDWNSLTEVEIYTDAEMGSVSKPAPTVPGARLAVNVVTASSDDGNVPANTLDGDLNTRWSAQGDGQWIQFDLGKVKTVSHLRIAFYKGDQRTTGFDIELSTDGESWTQVYSGQSSGSTTEPELFDFDDTPARYVRIIGHGNSKNDWNSLTEVEVYAP
ncbi:MAG: discoidin domain-containing protein, partial [Chloroflexi bacterium]